jgi:hypothetical protein
MPAGACRIRTACSSVRRDTRDRRKNTSWGHVNALLKGAIRLAPMRDLAEGYGQANHPQERFPLPLPATAPRPLSTPDSPAEDEIVAMHAGRVLKTASERVLPESYQQRRAILSGLNALVRENPLKQPGPQQRQFAAGPSNMHQNLHHCCSTSRRWRC